MASQAQQQPIDCLLHVVLSVKCARATHDFLREIFPVPASEGRIFLHPGDDDHGHDHNHDDNNGINDPNDNNNNNDGNSNGNGNDKDRDAVFVFPYVAVRFTSSGSYPCPVPSRPAGHGHGHGATTQLAVLVADVELVRARLTRRGVRFRDVDDDAEDGLTGWMEFSDPDGYRWRVGRLVWGR